MNSSVYIVPNQALLGYKEEAHRLFLAVFRLALVHNGAYVFLYGLARNIRRERNFVMFRFMYFNDIHY